MTRLALILTFLSCASALGGSVRKEPVTIEAARDDDRWIVLYKGADAWVIGQTLYLAIPVASGKPSPIGSFAVEGYAPGNRFLVKLNQKMGAYRKAKKGERLLAVFKIEGDRETAAVDESTEEAERPGKKVKGSNRMARRFGVSLGVGEPVGTLGGAGVHYNLFDFATLSAHVGLAPLGLVKTFGGSAGLKLYVPGWSLTPFIHPSVSFLKVSVDLNNVIGDVRFFGAVVDDGNSFLFFSVPFGIAYQARSGFAAQIMGSLLGLSTFSGASGIAFGGHLAWYF